MAREPAFGAAWIKFGRFKCPAAVCEIPPALGVNTGPNPQWNIDAKNTLRTHLVELPPICYCRISYLDDAFLHTLE
jgi:hypothetical protein